jgi:diadenosine tetraphosphate (Ap4A) HIT family hydrolase
MASGCPFCEPVAGAAWITHDAGLAIWDAFPLTEGHTLVVPRQHVASLYELTPAEQADLWTLVADVRARLRERFNPDGFTIGVNDGPSAGQTVGHAHIHVVPRRLGDVPDPRGGIRWVVPGRAAYWENR